MLECTTEATRTTARHGDAGSATWVGSACVVDIAGVRLGMRTTGGGFALGLRPAHAAFVARGRDADIRLTVHHGPLPPVDLSRPVFDSGGLWRLYRDHDGGHVITMASPAVGPGPYRVIRLDETLSRGDVHIEPYEWATRGRSPDGLPIVMPLEYPLDELLVVNKAADGSAVDIHACGVLREGAVSLFVGVSGAGKSTVARLVDKRPVRVLSDDRIVLRYVNGRPWAFGTPWHGDAGFASPRGGPLAAVHFLRKSETESLRRLSAPEAFTRTLVCSFPTFYLKDGMERTAQLLEGIVRAVPAYEFGFTPREEAMDFLFALVGH